jgi:DNA polymerase-3 subunit gamma/tau
VFDNILGQSAPAQLAADITAAALSPSMLFRGPEAAGKGTTALELARALSCGERAAWNCSCPQCARHRLLYHPDLLVLGARSFSPEIAAAVQVFSRDYEDPTARLLFIRAVRKLLLRFDPVLWEDDSGAGIKKAAPLAEALDADLDEVVAFHAEAAAAGTGAEKLPESGWAEKIGTAILKNAWKLEAEGVPGQIPVAQIRRASWWCRMAPLSKRKLLLIENADRMQDNARNALLKILEEPPETAVIVLCSSQPSALLPTIVSRLRPYYFTRRDAAVEREVIRRVFRAGNAAPGGGAADTEPARPGQRSLITAWLDGFLPVSPETLYPLACFFAVSLASRASAAAGSVPAALAALAEYAAPIAQKAGLPAPATAGTATAGTGDAAPAVREVIAGAGNFEAPGLFPRFLTQLLTVAGDSRRALLARGGESDEAFAEIWSALAEEAAAASGTYNIAIPLVLERMEVEFLRKIAALYGSG